MDVCFIVTSWDLSFSLSLHEDDTVISRIRSFITASPPTSCFEQYSDSLIAKVVRSLEQMLISAKSRKDD